MWHHRAETCRRRRVCVCHDVCVRDGGSSEVGARRGGSHGAQLAEPIEFIWPLTSKNREDDDTTFATHLWHKRAEDDLRYSWSDKLDTAASYFLFTDDTSKFYYLEKKWSFWKNTSNTSIHVHLSGDMRKINGFILMIIIIIILLLLSTHSLTVPTVWWIKWYSLFCSQDCGLLVQPGQPCGLQPFIKSQSSLQTCSSGHIPGLTSLPLSHIQRSTLMVLPHHFQFAYKLKSTLFM